LIQLWHACPLWQRLSLRRCACAACDRLGQTFKESRRLRWSGWSSTPPPATSGPQPSLSPTRTAISTRLMAGTWKRG
jgi:hypothetical protein